MNIDAREAQLISDLEVSRREAILHSSAEFAVSATKYLLLAAGGVATVIGGFNLGRALGEQSNPSTQTTPTTNSSYCHEGAEPLPENPADMLIQARTCQLIEQEGGDITPLLTTEPQS